MVDTTTIQVQKTTVHALGRLKQKFGVRSYDKVIQKLAQKEIRIKKSLFGAHPKMKPFRRLEDDFHDI